MRSRSFASPSRRPAFGAPATRPRRSRRAPTALAMFGGDILSGAGDGEWVIPHRARLEEVRLGLVEDQLAARLDLGAAGDVIGELEALVRVHPLREGLWALLMVALYRDGRQADALATYQRARSWLADELGLDPGLQLQQLEQQILVHDPALGAPSSAGARARRRTDRPGTCRRCPRSSSGATPRSRRSSISSTAQRLVEIVGPGGVGKTALAIAAGRALSARRRRRRRRRVAGPTRERGDRRRGGRHVGRGARASSGEAALFERLKSSAALVILDNCEHVIDAAAALAVRLLDAAPGLADPVHQPGPPRRRRRGRVRARAARPRRRGRVVHPSGRCAAQRSARRARPDDAVEELCRSLDGLPLAIELAAARTRTLSIEEITRRLDDRFTVLSDPTSRRPERRRALKSTIGWSYELLFPDDQRGLWALATFAGGAPLAGGRVRPRSARGAGEPRRSTSSAGSRAVRS